MDVVVVGAGPTGLMLAGELGLAGVRALVLERRPTPSQTPRAGGLAGHVLQLLHYRGELARFQEASPAPEPTPRFPFGGLHLDFTILQHSPMGALLLPQPRLEELLAERATERGAEVRRGHEVVGLRQGEDGVTVQVRGPRSPYEVDAAFLVGCDGGRSRVRALGGIAFPGTSLPEIERLASVTAPESVTVLEDGSLEVPEVGRIPFGYTATEHGVFACHGGDGVIGVYTAEVEETQYDDETPMTVTELSESVRRVLGVQLPMGEPLRMTRFGYSARQADAYRSGRVFLAGDAAHLFPAGGVAVNAGMLDAANLAWKLAADGNGWAPPDLLDSYPEERRAAAERTLLHTRAQVALRRAHGPGGDALRALFVELTHDEQPLRRLGALMAGTDLGTPAKASQPLVGTFVTDLALGVEHRDPRFTGLLGSGRGVILDLADEAPIRELASPWEGRVDVLTVAMPDRRADALLIRPDGVIAWAATVGEPWESVWAGGRDALTAWFGSPSVSP